MASFQKPTSVLKAWIIYPRYVSLHADNAFGWMQAEACACGIELDVIFYEDLALHYGGGKYGLFHKQAPVSSYPEVVVVRGYEYAISRHFELLGIPVVNTTASMYLSKDKTLTSQLLALHGVPVPRSVAYAGIESSYGFLCSLFASQRFIVKQNDGAKGENVFLVSDEGQFARAVERCRHNCLFQQFIEGSSGRDIRVWVIGGRAAAAVGRYSESSFLSNFSQGGKVAPQELTQAISDIAEKAAALTGLEFAGVDLLYGPDGYLVCEVNGNAGFRTLSKVAENNIPARLFEYIKDKYGK